jgi:hypothetical protein
MSSGVISVVTSLCINNSVSLHTLSLSPNCLIINPIAIMPPLQIPDDYEAARAQAKASGLALNAFGIRDNQGVMQKYLYFACV